MSNKPKLHVWLDQTQKNAITVSAYEMDDPMWENNHITIAIKDVTEGYFGLNLLSNVLQQAGVEMVRDA